MDLWRQTDILAMTTLNTPITLVGAGGIGSMTGLALAKMGMQKMVVIDPDTVEPHNIPNQMYPTAATGKTKVSALAHMARDFAVTRIVQRATRYNPEIGLTAIVISALDSFAARAELFDGVTRNPAVSIFIDGRMMAETIRIISIDPHNQSDLDYYQSTLMEDTPDQLGPCTARAIIYNTMLAGGMIASQVKKHLMKQSPPRNIVLDLVTMMMVVEGRN